MPEALKADESNANMPAGPAAKAIGKNNILEELFANMIEETYTKSSYNPDSYRAPYNPDDLYQRTFDYSIYEKMTIDDQIDVCLRLKKDLILGEGFMIVPGEEGQDEIVDFLNDALTETYEGNFFDDLEELLTSYDYGFSLTEKIFMLRDDQMIGIRSMKTRHPNTWLIHTDDKGCISKYEQKTVKGNIDVNPKSLIHIINNKQFQNPYGRSDLRSAYNAWIAKVHVMRYFSVYLEKAASPIPVGRYDKNAPAGFSDVLLQILKTFQTKTAIAVAKDVELEFLEAKSTGEAYHKAINIFNMIIGRALFVPDLVGFTGGETGGGSLALGKEQMNLFFMHIMRRKNSLEQAVNKEIIKILTVNNFGFVKNPPKFKLKPVDDSKSIELAKVWLDAVKGKTYKPNPEEISYFRKLVQFPDGEVEFNEPLDLGGEGDKEDEDTQPKEGKPGDDQEDKSKDPKAPDKKEFAKAYSQVDGDYHKKVDFKSMKTKLDDYDNSLVNECSPIVKKMIRDLYDQIEKKKILQNQNPEKMDSLSLKYKKDLKQVLKKSFYDLYKDAQNQAKTEVTKSNFAKPLDNDKFLQLLDNEVYNFVGDFEYTILKRTRVELTAAIKDGRPLSSVISILTDELEPLTEVQLERYSRTKHTEVMNNGRLEYFESTGVVTGYQYSAIMDDRTSDICSGLHGKFFKAGTEPIPPMHFNCRSTLIPITKYESFKPTESIRGKYPQAFIDANKGSGFGTK